MTFRDIYRYEVSLRGIRHKDQIESEEWADQREPVGAFLMDSECPTDMVAKMHRIFGELIDECYAPLRMRQ